MASTSPTTSPQARPTPVGEVSSTDEETDSSAESAEENRRRLQAQSIRESFKSPALWMLAVGAVLAACAGIVNVVAFEELNTFVGHLTGTLSKTAMELEGVHMVDKFDPSNSTEHLLLILSFVFGAFLCGLVIDKNTVHFGGKSFYGVALIGNSALLCGAVAVAPRRGAAYLAATACGLQNAMCTSHFTAVVRTTHVTGSFTDIGSTAGRIVAILLRRQCGKRISHVDKAELWVDGTKLKILSLLCSGFFLGCFIGIYLQEVWGKYAWLLPAAITGTMGTGYTLVSVIGKQFLKKYEDDRMAEEVREVEDHIQRACEVIRRARADTEAGMTSSDSETHGISPSIGHELEHCLEIVRDFSAILDARQWIPPTNVRPSHTGSTGVLPVLGLDRARSGSDRTEIRAASF